MKAKFAERTDRALSLRALRCAGRALRPLDLGIERTERGRGALDAKGASRRLLSRVARSENTGQHGTRVREAV